MCIRDRTCVDNLLFGGDSIKDIVDDSNFAFINSDINDWKSLNDVLVSGEYFSVIHLAAIVGDPACKLNEELAIKTNWDSSVWLLDRAKELGVSRFIFASTCSNYGKMSNSQSYVDETSSLAPVSLYAELKVRFENYMLNEEKHLDNFIKMIDWLRTNTRIDENRIFAFGQSAGAMFLYEQVVSRQHDFAAIGLVMGNYYDCERSSIVIERCVEKRPLNYPNQPVSILHLHGQMDNLVPFNGGPIGQSDDLYVNSVYDTATTISQNSMCNCLLYTSDAADE